MCLISPLIFLFIYFHLFVCLYILFCEGNLKPGRVNSNDLRSIADAVKGKRQRLGRALVLKDNDVEQIVNEHRGIYEQSYQILRKWWQGGSKATYSALAQALHDRTVNMGRVATTFCLEKTGF